jgi:hypothetical protein
MLVYEKKDNKYIFIHIPKNAGKYIRQNIRFKYKVIKSFWGIKNNFDLAHIPYCKMNQYIKNIENYKIYAYSRNPYDRIISAFFYKNKNKNRNINDFKKFCKNELLKFNFNKEYPYTYIHYYPQYMFVCDDNNNYDSCIKIKKIEEPKTYDLSKYLDDECIYNINLVYEKDFKLFGYEIIKV